MIADVESSRNRILAIVSLQMLIIFYRMEEAP